MPKKKANPPRIKALKAAGKLIVGDREEQYGAPKDNLNRIALYWSEITRGKDSLTPEDVAAMMVALKLCRYINTDSGYQEDTWLDMIGYAALGYEVGDPRNQG